MLRFVHRLFYLGKLPFESCNFGRFLGISRGNAVAANPYRCFCFIIGVNILCKFRSVELILFHDFPYFIDILVLFVGLLPILLKLLLMFRFYLFSFELRVVKEMIVWQTLNFIFEVAKLQL